MSAHDLTSALAQLLTNAKLRMRFRGEPESVATQFNLDSGSWRSFCNMDPDELDRQADCLLSKRCHEASQILPQTWKRLGQSESRQLFYTFAATYWPEGHRRHWLDALKFCEFLRKRKVAGLVRSELNWVRFCQSRSRVRIHLIRELICKRPKAL